MAKKIKSITPVATIATDESMSGVVLDHSSQAGSWASAPESTDERPELRVHMIEAIGMSDKALDFNGAMSALDDSAVSETVHKIAELIDERKRLERLDHPDNESIQKNLDKARRLLVTKRAARVLMATNVEPAFINRQVHTGARYNVYALGKLADIVKALTGEKLENAINKAVIKSLFQCSAAKVQFTMEVAKACASDKYNVDATIRKHLVRHDVSTSTAPTQASSTMQALVTLGVVNATGGKNPTYTLNDNGVAELLRAVAA